MPRENIPLKMQLEVWKRDNWHCRYCGNPVFFAKALKLFDKINPQHLYFHPNGKNGEILPLFQWSWASVDHIIAVSAGGQNDISNYVTACWRCNLKYRDMKQEEGKPTPLEIKKSRWDVFYGIFEKLSKSR